MTDMVAHDAEANQAPTDERPLLCDGIARQAIHFYIQQGVLQESKPVEILPSTIKPMSSVS